MSTVSPNSLTPSKVERLASIMDPNTSQRVAPFRYSPLPTLPNGAAYIRLLQVLDDEYSGDIKVRCRMTTWAVDDTPPYRAISYTWGDPNSCSTILVNDEVFPVRTNCEFVLKQAYWYEKTSYYWVDAICINQENLAEKSTQVSRMGSIYKQASQVLACVGNHADDSEFLFNMLKQRAFTKRLFPRDASMTISLRFKLRQRFSATLRFLHAAVRLLERPYFTRLWVLQELHCAREAIFMCGSNAVPQNAIHAMVEGMRTIGDFDEHYDWKIAHVTTNISMRLLVIRRFLTVQVYRSVLNRDNAGGCDSLYCSADTACLLVGVEAELIDLLEAAEALECQERKDKVFGLIALVNWSASTPLIPDYMQTELEIAFSFFGALLNHWNQGGDISSVRIYLESSTLVRVLQLDSNSIGVPNEIESRRIEPGNYTGGENNYAKYKHTRHNCSRGWRVTGEYLAKNNAGFSTWSPLGSDNCKVHLPIWAEDGDWIVVTSSTAVRSEKCFMLVKEDVEGLGGPLVGRAVSGDFDAKKMVGVWFGIHWSPEDLIISSIVDRAIPIDERGGVSGQYPSEWVQALNTAVCKKNNPGWSYAFRCDGISCFDPGSWV